MKQYHIAWTSVLIVLLGSESACSSAEQTVSPANSTPSCSNANAKEAELSIDKITGWRELAAYQKKFGSCDEAAIAEGIDDVVVRLLTTRWQDINVASKLALADPAFKEFIVRHISDLASVDELEAVKANASGKCPAESEALCVTIVRRVESLSK